MRITSLLEGLTTEPVVAPVAGEIQDPESMGYETVGVVPEELRSLFSLKVRLRKELASKQEKLAENGDQGFSQELELQGVEFQMVDQAFWSELVLAVPALSDRHKIVLSPDWQVWAEIPADPNEDCDKCRRSGKCPSEAMARAAKAEGGLMGGLMGGLLSLELIGMGMGMGEDEEELPGG